MYDGYNYYSPYTQPQRVNSQQNCGGSFVWVNSRKEAEEYPLGANGAVMLMNRNEKAFYLKACDGFGMVLYFKEYPYYEKTPDNSGVSKITQEAESPEYVKKSEWEKLKKEFDELRAYINPEYKEGEKNE